MKKKLYLLTTILTVTSALFLSSCLKDNAHYLNFNTGQTFVDFPLGGFANFSADAITETPDTDVNGTIVRQFAVNVASANLTTAPTTVTLALGTQADVDALNGLQSSVSFLMMPSNAYSFTTTTVTIPAGKLYVITSITFYKNLLDPSKSYVLPVKIVSGTGAKLTANLNIHYFHFIGNDFAGSWEHYYTRWSNGDSTTVVDQPRSDKGPTTFSPVSATEFTVPTFYYTGPNYDITFTKTGVGAAATYSNFAVQFLPADVAAGTGWAGAITVTVPPKFVTSTFAFDPNAQYTYAQALHLFRIYFHTSSRAIIDDYQKN